MWVVYRGKVHIMMYDVRKKKSVYIRENTWDKMSAEEKMRYV